MPMISDPVFGGDMVNISSRVGECCFTLNDIRPLATLG